jgi:hypothetical protein
MGAIAFLGGEVWGLVQTRSEQVECKLALGDLGVATAFYALNNDNFLPHEDAGSSKPPKDMCWYQVLDPYIQRRPIAWAKQDPTLRDLHQDDITHAGFSYKMNSRLEEYKGEKSYYSDSFRHLSSISDPSQTMLYFDGDVSEHHINKPYGMYNQVVNRHRDQANLLFIDQHVDSSSGGFESENWSGPGGYLWDPDVSLDQQ